MSYIEFQVGEAFPLPIKAQGDGGIFQYDVNGAMFILKLSRVDLIAIEAFRTGEIELGLFAEKGVTFFLYKIDGIVNGWGDCPYSARELPSNQRPNFEKQRDATLNLYLLDSRLNVLLAMRTATLADAFHDALVQLTKAQLKGSHSSGDYLMNVQSVWRRYTSSTMYENALATQKIGIALGSAREAQK